MIELRGHNREDRADRFNGQINAHNAAGQETTFAKNVEVYTHQDLKKKAWCHLDFDVSVIISRKKQSFDLFLSKIDKLANKLSQAKEKITEIRKCVTALKMFNLFWLELGCSIGLVVITSNCANVANIAIKDKTWRVVLYTFHLIDTRWSGPKRSNDRTKIGVPSNKYNGPNHCSTVARKQDDRRGLVVFQDNWWC